jgi:soluble lytic murein transglycosylase-like protein
MNNIHKTVLLVAGFGLYFGICRLQQKLDEPKVHVKTEAEIELAYYQQAAKLNDVLFKEGTPVRSTVVVELLKQIDKQLPVWYPNGPFRRNDIIAMAWLESEFRQFEVGTHGERGVFQIMPCEFKDYNVHKNYYDIDLNTDIMFRVLDGKFKKHGDYKKSIMAYNGLVHFHNGKYSEKYWKAFEKRRIAIDLVLGAQ